MRTIIAWALAASATLVCATLPARAADKPPARSGIGINLEPPRYWESDAPFIDEFKRAGGWFTECSLQKPECRGFATGESSANTREQAKLDLDENGWVRRLPAASDPTAKYRSVAALLFQGDGGAHVAGRYVVLYDGRGSIEYSGIGKKVAAESRPGRDVVEVSKSAAALTIRIREVAEGDHIRNIRVIPPGGVCSSAPAAYVADASACARAADYRSLERLQPEQTFHPSFLGDMNGFRVIRFMPWAWAVESTLATWADRPKRGDAMWSTSKGVPVEVMLELAKRAGADPWISVPPRVDDDYARQLGRLLKRELRGRETIYLEYGNEPWNSAYPYIVAGKWFESQGRALWPDAKGNDLKLRLNWYALRAAQICRIVKAEFADTASRVKCVANGQVAAAVVGEWMLACDLAKPLLGRECAREFDAYAVAPYFGHYLGSPGRVAEMKRWTEEPDGGLDRLFAELEGRGGGDNAPNAAAGKGPGLGALGQLRGWLADSKKLADRYGLPLISYEGGQHLVAPRGATEVNELFRAANRDPRMAAALLRIVDDWKRVGGQLFIFYTYAGRTAHFGLKRAQFDDDAPKWQAVKTLRDQPCWWADCQAR